MKVAFLVNDLQLSGGIGVVVAHARQLVERHGFDVTLVLAREQEAPHWRYETLEHLHVATLADAHEDRFDVAVGTWWETAYSLFTVPADRHAMFVQSFEDRFYEPGGDPARHWAALVSDLPVAYLTEARWIADTLADLRPDALCLLVRNGIDKAVFAPPAAAPRRLAGPLRVLVEGDPGVWFKGVEDAVAATRLMAEPHHVTLVSGAPPATVPPGVDRRLDGLSHAEMHALYAESDVLLKLSRVEGMFGPPLEAFHAGTTCVTTPVTGHEEYVVHGENALLCDWDDLRGTARLLDLLARDRALLHRLRAGALETARAWPDWERQGALMALALRRVHAAPEPRAAPALARLLADARAGLEAHRGDAAQIRLMRGRLARFDRVLVATGLARVLMARRDPRVARVARLARRVAGGR